MKRRLLISFILISIMLQVSCGVPSELQEISVSEPVEEDFAEEPIAVTETETEILPTEEIIEESESEQSTERSVSETDEAIIPPYQGSLSVEINGNVPSFHDNEKTTESFESYSDLDELGRCGVAYACIGSDLMPTEERGQIGEIRPSGWHTVKYDGIDGNYLYNRCHLIAYCLTGENANEKNLITGTRYMNKEGMNPYENMVADYINRTGHHVLYRVTPIFDGDNLLASGVEMEAESMEDDEISFHVYCYNVQPGIEIDYASGESSGPEYTGQASESEAAPAQDSLVFPEDTTYILNTNTHRFHYIDCNSVREMSEKNRQTTNETRDQLMEEGYVPCGNCKP